MWTEGEGRIGSRLGGSGFGFGDFTEGRRERGDERVRGIRRGPPYRQQTDGMYEIITNS